MPLEILVDVSDIHCGSVYGLAAPESKTESGNVVTHGDNLHQRWLWSMWLEMCLRVTEIIGDTPKENVGLLLNGDMTEGVHHRNEHELMMALIDSHCNMAEYCLRPLVALADKVFVTKGTECHTKNIENYLAAKLGAEGGTAKDKWHIRINGCLVDAAHHMTTTGRAYLEASAMSILMGNARINYLRNRHEVPQVFLRAHRHCGGYFSDGAGLFGVTGAWQMLTRHGGKVVTDSIPSPTVLVLDWRGKAHGELPQPREIKFNQPQSEIYES